MGALRATLGLFIGLAFGLGAGRARGADAPDFETWLGTQRDGAGRPCDRRAMDATADYRIIACGEAGLWVVRETPEGNFVLSRSDDLGGPVVGLFRRDGRIWAEIARREARDVHPVDDTGNDASFPADSTPMLAPLAPSATAPPPSDTPSETPERAKPLEGRVTAVLPGEVLVSLGSEHGLRHGDRVELSTVTTLELGAERAERRTVAAVGVVRVVSERFARVELGIGERVPVGAIARLVAGPSSKSRVAPPRLGGLWHAGFMARPFVALDDLGGGMLLDASAGYRFDFDFHVEAVASPVGWGTGDDKPSVTPVSAYVKASYEPRLFEVGFGVGAETVYDTPFGTDSGSGVLFVQQLRLGARDGLHLDLRSHAGLFHSRFAFSGFAGSGQIPVGDRWWLLLNGGGGRAGYGFGEVAVRALLRGNGDRGSFFFTGSAGGGGVFEERSRTCTGEGFTFPCPESVSYVGPMLGVGGEWRF